MARRWLVPKRVDQKWAEVKGLLLHLVEDLRKNMDDNGEDFDTAGATARGGGDVEMKDE